MPHRTDEEVIFYRMRVHEYNEIVYLRFSKNSLDVIYPSHYTIVVMYPSDSEDDEEYGIDTLSHYVMDGVRCVTELITNAHPPFWDLDHSPLDNLETIDENEVPRVN